MEWQRYTRRAKMLTLTGLRTLAASVVALGVVVLARPTTVCAGILGLPTDSLRYELSHDSSTGDVARIDFSLEWLAPIDSLTDTIINVGVEISYDIDSLTFTGWWYDTTNWNPVASFIQTPTPGKIIMVLQGDFVPTPSTLTNFAHFTFTPIYPGALNTNSIAFTTDVGDNEITFINIGGKWSPKSSLFDPCCLIAGDANGDGALDISDVSFLIARIFNSGPAPTCCGAADINSDGSVNISDVSASIARIFAGGRPPACGPAGIGCQ